MSGPSPQHSPPPVLYLTEPIPGASSLRLAAAVVCRGVPTVAARLGGGGSQGWLRAVRHRLWAHLGPVGLDVTVGGRSLYGGAADAARSVGSVGIGHRGEPLAYYDAGSRELRVLGRVVPAPRGETLVALIDATGSRAQAPHLVLRVVPTPSILVPHFASERSLPGETRTYIVGGEEPAWSAALREDAVVRAFLDAVHAG